MDNNPFKTIAVRNLPLFKTIWRFLLKILFKKKTAHAPKTTV
jgi:hypothetical protein